MNVAVADPDAGPALARGFLPSTASASPSLPRFINERCANPLCQAPLDLDGTIGTLCVIEAGAITVELKYCSAACVLQAFDLGRVRERARAAGDLAGMVTR